MTKRYLMAVWLMLGLLLAACQPPADSPDTTQEEAGESAVAEQPADEVAAADEEEVDSLEADAPVVAEPEVIEVEIEPVETGATPTELAAEKVAYAPAMTPQEIIEVRNFDWSKGSEEAVITIIEYGDFQ